MAVAIGIITLNVILIGITASWWFTPFVILAGVFLFKIDEL